MGVGDRLSGVSRSRRNGGFQHGLAIGEHLLMRLLGLAGGDVYRLVEGATRHINLLLLPGTLPTPRAGVAR